MSVKQFSIKKNNVFYEKLFFERFFESMQGLTFIIGKFEKFDTESVHKIFLSMAF